MTRTAPWVREASADDLPALLGLWAQLREISRDPGLRSVRDPVATIVERAGERLEHCIGDPECRVLVCERDDSVVGMAILTVSRVGQLLEQPAVQLSHLVVAPGHRRRGVGRSLVGAAVAWAEQLGAEQVVVSVLPSLREANRFYAQLGFAPLVVRRVAPVSALRRRLAQLDRHPALASAAPRRRVLAGVRGGLAVRSSLGWGDPNTGLDFD